MKQLDRVLDRVRQPAYTGGNRCWPCTALNLAIVAVLAGALLPVDRLLALLVVVAGTLAVYVRGYLLPGTPRFAPRLVEPLPVDFGHDPPETGG